MQKKFRNRHLYKLTKQALIHDFWNKILGELKAKAFKGGGREVDKKMLNLCTAVEAIPVDIRRYLLE